MMEKRYPFEPLKVKGLVDDITAIEKSLPGLKLAAQEADVSLRQAETRLANLRIELTKAIDAHIDVDSLSPRARGIVLRD